jgi:hypothetical protein
MSVSDPFVVSLAIIVLAANVGILLRFLLPARYDASKKGIGLAINILMPTVIYFSALHFHPDMSTARFTGFIAFYLAVIFIRSRNTMKVSR